MGFKSRYNRQRGQLRHPAFAATFAMIYPGMTDRARALGYALCLHGTMARDLDLVAVPWIETAAPAEELVESLRSHLGAFVVTRSSSPDRDPLLKPHGRLCWALHLVGSGVYIDLSVMLRSGEQPPPDVRRE